MTTAHVEKFAELVIQDPALQARLGWEKVNADAAAATASADAARASAEAFIANAVNEAKALGLSFTEAEAHVFMADQEAAAAQGELNDTQLEAVAGGSQKMTNMNKFTTAFNAASTIQQAIRCATVLAAPNSAVGRGKPMKASVGW